MDRENRFAFTVEKLARVTCPPEQVRAWVYDAKSNGLAYCVTGGGARLFYLYRRIKGKPQRMRLGKAGEGGMSLDTARKRAAQLNDQIFLGKDPIAEKRAAIAAALKETATIGNLWVSYRDHHLVGKRARTIKEFTRVYDAHIAPWAKRPADAITFADVEALKVRVGESSHSTANKVLTILSAMYRKRGHAFGLPRNWTPTDGVDDYPEQPRERVLSIEELARVIKSIEAEENWTARDYFKMLIYTGARRENVARMRRENININMLDGKGAWTIPGMKTKNGRPLVVNLPDEAVKIIHDRDNTNPEDSPWVFPSRRVTPAQADAVKALRAAGKSTHYIARQVGISQTAVMNVLNPTYTVAPLRPFDGAGKAWERILIRAGLKGEGIENAPTIHDVRRTYITQLIERGIPLPIVSAAVGHRSMQTTLKHYAHASDKAVGDATRKAMTGMLADVAKVQAQDKGKRKSA